MNEHTVNIAILPEVLLDSEQPKVTYDNLSHLLHIETSKRYMDVPVKRELINDKGFSISYFVQSVWSKHWKKEFIK